MVSGNSWNIETKGNFAALIDDETFDRAKVILALGTRSFNRRQTDNPDFPLRHFVKCGACGKPLTASYSTGRARRKYPYYRCQNRSCASPVNETKQVIEGGFLSFLQCLRPKPEIIGLFKKIVCGAWEEKQNAAAAECTVYQRQIRELRNRKDKLFDAYSGSVLNLEEYREMKEVIDQELTLVQVRESDSRLKEGDFEDLLGFAETIFLDPVTFWENCSLDQKRRFQGLIFPEGLQFENGNYRTQSTCLLFSLLQPGEGQKEDLVALTGIEPVF